MFGKIWLWLARIAERFYVAQMDWLVITAGMYDNYIKIKSERTGASERERRKLWEVFFTVSEWDETEWEDVEDAQADAYDAYAESIQVMTKVLSELNFTPLQIKGILAALITNPTATTSERQERFIRNWFTLTRQLPGMSDQDLNSVKEGRAIESRTESLKTQIRVEIMKWIIPETSDELREDLIALTSCNNKGESDVNLMSVCNVKAYAPEEYLDPISNNMATRALPAPPVLTPPPILEIHKPTSPAPGNLYEELKEAIKKKKLVRKPSSGGKYDYQKSVKGRRVSKPPPMPVV